MTEPSTLSHLYILTGASRGMGLAMAQQLLLPGHTVLCISRGISDDLPAQARDAGATLEQWAQDLSQGAEAAARLGEWLGRHDGAAFASATLVNNAGVVARIAPLSATDPARPDDLADLANALRVGLEAPMQLTAAFLHATAAWPGARRVLNISSGLGRNAMASQSAYCAAKAGMDHFTRCVALDEAQRANGAKVCSLAPGVIDSGMQVQLRSASPESFPDQARFAGMKAQGALTSPHDAAARLIAWLARPDFGKNVVADVRDV